MDYFNEEPESSTSPPASPSKAAQRPIPSSSLRLDTSGVNPSNLIGKVLQRVVRSSRHPMVTLHFRDSTAFQIHVEGYHPNPTLRGVPKELEMDSSFADILSLCEEADSPDLDLLITDCTFVRLTDKAFERNGRNERWDQNHLALAFKFEGLPSWHCVWAAVVEHDNRESGVEIFRSYEDVYLHPVARSPQVSPNKSPSKSRFPARGRRRQSYQEK
ncbi:hypothetical protein M422DRAFT_161230 [Sphaerobolus stellatus SS14]|nr:hypothetical protein M422DRAFT_161230 [Sphaerobolus stellatus SS14]